MRVSRVKLYDYPLSGNGYKVRLLLSHLARPYEYVPIDILRGESRSASFLRKNAAGKVPVLELDSGETLAESNAILCFLARDTPYWPDGPLDQAQVLRWLFFEQRDLMPSVGGARYWLTIHESELTEADRITVRKMQEKGRKALTLLDRHLHGRDFVAGPGYSIADIALYAYTHLADEGGIDLTAFDAIVNWTRRVREQPGYVGIDTDAVRNQ